MSTPVLSSEPEATPPSANLSGVLTLMEDLVSEVAEESRAKTTRYQQGQQWKTFSEWCDERGLQSLPADPETVAVFIFTQGIGGKKPNTLRGYASSIAAEHRSEGHDSPCTDRVAMVIKGFVNRAKEAGQREKRAKPLTGEDLEKIRETACNPRKTDRGMERFSNARRRGLVDIALISVMRDALLRRSEAAEILGNTSPPSRTAPAPLGQANDARVARLRTSVRRAIIGVIAHLLHIGHHGIGRCVGWLAAPVPVSHGGGSLLPVSRQNAPGVPSGDTHQRGCLIQCHVLREQTVQNLKSGLFFWIQSHILHTVNMTFMLAS